MKNGFLCHKCLKRIKYKFLHPMHHNKIKSVYITTAFAKRDRNSYQLWYHNYKSGRNFQEEELWTEPNVPLIYFLRSKWSFFFHLYEMWVWPITSTNNVIPLLQRHTSFVCLLFKYTKYEDSPKLFWNRMIIQEGMAALKKWSIRWDLVLSGLAPFIPLKK